jgi:hypothetical protein
MVAGTAVAHWFDGFTDRVESGEKSACGQVYTESGVNPDDGRPRCKRCLAAEAKAKEGKR